MKKQKIHFSLYPGCVSVSACRSEVPIGFFDSLIVTNRRSRVTCKRCKATKRFRGIK